jgi:hypothetical protein
MFKSISVLNRPFLRRFSTFQAAWKAYLTSLTPSTTTLWPGTPLPLRQWLVYQAVLEPPSQSLPLSK